jgi:hypothetical protein
LPAPAAPADPPLSPHATVDNAQRFPEHHSMIQVPVSFAFVSPMVGRFRPVSGLLAALLRVGLVCPPRCGRSTG